MPFKSIAQKFNAAIAEVTIGSDNAALTLGGENVFSLYSFDCRRSEDTAGSFTETNTLPKRQPSVVDGAIQNPPRVGIEFSDLGPDRTLPEIAAFYEGAESIAAITRRACEKSGADFVSLILDGADPNGKNRTVEECAALCSEAIDAATLPLVIQGCKNAEKDGKLFEKIAEALQGKNVLLLSAREENYKSVAVGAVLAYGQKAGAESSVDVNLAKQLNVLISQLGVQQGDTVMNIGSAAAGYGFEYVASTMERVKAAALAQNDTMLQMPIVTPVGAEAWSVKEATAPQEDFPEWGPVEQRGIDMEIATAAASLAAGSNAVILRHPASIPVIKKLITELL